MGVRTHLPVDFNAQVDLMLLSSSDVLVGGFASQLSRLALSLMVNASTHAHQPHMSCDVFQRGFLCQWSTRQCRHHIFACTLTRTRTFTRALHTHMTDIHGCACGQASRQGRVPPFISVDGYPWGRHAQEEMWEVAQELGAVKQDL